VINDVKTEASERMGKSMEALSHNFNKIRSGRAHPSLLEGLKVEYYGSLTPITQMANISVEDARTLTLTAWDRSTIPEIEKAIYKSDLGLNPATAGEVIRIPMPMLTEEARKGFTRQARHEAESARVSVRSARRDAMSMLKELVKDKEISEDDERRGQDEVQKLTDGFVAKIEKLLAEKEAALMEI
jgi:ribosome recycling factor